MRGRINALWEDYVVTRRTAFLIVGVMLVVALLFCSVSSYMIVEWRALFAARDPAQRLTAEQYFGARNRLFTTAVGLIGAVGLLGTLFFTWRNFLLAESGQITDRFAKAVELLGAVRDVGDGRVEPNIEARLGAIYALERIAQDSARDHWQVMEVLTAYLRSMPAPELAREARKPSPRTDCQAALTVIGRRRRSQRREWIQTLQFNGAHLEGVDFGTGYFGRACFDEARLDGVTVDSTNFVGTSLWKASMKSARLWSAIMEGADLENADLEGADLNRVNLKDANLQGANLKDANFHHVVGLTREQLDSTASYKGAKNLPPHLTPDTRGEAQAPSSPEPTP